LPGYAGRADPLSGASNETTAGGSKDEALVAFHGDIGGRIDGKLQLLEQARSVSDESLQKAAGYGSRLYRGPYFWIARPGAFGSSGHHVKDRRTLLEIRIAMAAFDALKQHYGFKRFHLVGHSGGSEAPEDTGDDGCDQGGQETGRYGAGEIFAAVGAAGDGGGMEDRLQDGRALISRPLPLREIGQREKLGNINAKLLACRRILNIRRPNDTATQWQRR